MKKESLENKKIIYESYNLEYELMKQSLGDSLLGKLLLRHVHRIEKSLSLRAIRSLRYLQRTRSALLQITAWMIERSSATSNGELAWRRLDRCAIKSSGNAKKCVFIGSFDPPNIEAVENIVQIAKRMPGICFALLEAPLSTTEIRLGTW